MSAGRISTYDAEPDNPSPADLPAFVPYVCKQMQLSFTVRVKTETQEEYVSKVADDKNKKGKSKKSVPVPQIVMSTSDKDSQIGVIVATDYSAEDNEIVINCTLNADDQVVGVTLKSLIYPPQLLIKVVALSLPFCVYLTTLTVRLCKIRGAILYEIAKALPQSHITDLILDDTSTVLAERCYYMFFDQPNKLQSLSLARCNISDEDCTVLMSCLVHPLPASKTLKTLDLTGNTITDIGARSIGECLRSNRSLKYLNLAGNQIGEDGAAEILESLAEFPLTCQEIKMKKQRLVDFLKMRQDVFNKFYEEITNVFLEKGLEDSNQAKVSKRKTPRRKSSTTTILPLPKNDLSAKAEMMTQELVGTYSEPFGSEQTVVRNNYLHCTGNMSLCYLNFSYNNLSYTTLKKLVNIVKYQRGLMKTMGVGLLNVQLVGNNLPECMEMYVLQDQLEQAKFSQMVQKIPSRTRSKSIHLKKLH